MEKYFINIGGIYCIIDLNNNVYASNDISWIKTNTKLNVVSEIQLKKLDCKVIDSKLDLWSFNEKLNTDVVLIDDAIIDKKQGNRILFVNQKNRIYQRDTNGYNYDMKNPYPLCDICNGGFRHIYILENKLAYRCGAHDIKDINGSFKHFYDY